MQANVVMSGSVSKDFLVSNGVKQGCVLALTLFSLYLAAMIEVTFKDTTEGVYIQTRKDGCSDEGLTLETSAKHHIPQATNIPYQPC